MPIVFSLDSMLQNGATAPLYMSANKRKLLNFREKWPDGA